MAKEFAQSFYNSTKWKRCREDYKKYRHYLCERCLAQGLFTPGEIVHHKIRLDPHTIQDESITLNFDNLELLCREHHEAEHKSERKKDRGLRYRIDDDGRVIVNENFSEKK